MRNSISPHARCASNKYYAGRTSRSRSYSVVATFLSASGDRVGDMVSGVFVARRDGRTRRRVWCCWLVGWSGFYLARARMNALLLIYNTVSNLPIFTLLGHP